MHFLHIKLYVVNCMLHYNCLKINKWKKTENRAWACHDYIQLGKKAVMSNFVEKNVFLLPTLTIKSGKEVNILT